MRAPAVAPIAAPAPPNKSTLKAGDRERIPSWVMSPLIPPCRLKAKRKSSRFLVALGRSPLNLFIAFLHCNQNVTQNTRIYISIQLSQCEEEQSLTLSLTYAESHTFTYNVTIFLSARVYNNNTVLS